MNATIRNEQTGANGTGFNDAATQAREAAQAARDQAQAARDQAQSVRDQVRDAIRHADQAVDEAAIDDAPQGTRPAQAPGTIVIPTDGGQDINISVDGRGIHVNQGETQTTIPIHDVVPRGAVQIAYTIPIAIGLFVVGWPIARALARWIDRRGTASAATTRLSAEVQTRLDAMERNIDTVAVELERVSEGQRFTSKLLTERLQPLAPDFAAASAEPSLRAPVAHKGGR